MLNRLIKNIASFIPTQNEIASAIITSIANMFTSLKSEISILYNSNWSGSGLKLEADAYKIFYNVEESDADIQTRLSDRFNKLSARGTENGIKDDLGSLLGSNYVNARFLDKNQSGIIVDNTYIGVDAEAIIDFDGGTAIDVNNPVTNKENKTIRDTIVPIGLTIIYE